MKKDSPPYLCRVCSLYFWAVLMKSQEIQQVWFKFQSEKLSNPYILTRMSTSYWTRDMKGF